MANKENQRCAEEVAALVHELQAPLTVLRVQLEKALQASWCGPECRVALEPCLDHLRSASQMISDLLLLERDNAREQPPSQQASGLEDLVTEASRTHFGLAESKGVSIALDKVPATRVMGNFGELRRILANLLDNAVRHTASGGTVRVRAAVTRRYAELQVIDAGPGIPPEHRPHIFERFYRIDRNADRATGNVGLGLAIARSLAERNGAQLDFESTPGGGSTFILRLPVAAKDD